MIDTDKYEGHSKEWTLNHNDWAWATSMFTDAGETNEADALLIADSPLLLAEVKRLREAIKVATIDLEEPNMHEETRKDLLDVLKEMIE